MQIKRKGVHVWDDYWYSFFILIMDELFVQIYFFGDVFVERKYVGGG